MLRTPAPRTPARTPQIPSSVAGTPAVNTPATPNKLATPINSGQTPFGEVAAPEEIDWDKVDSAMDFFQKLDVLELASSVIQKAISKGPKDIYNEAGPVRFKVSQAKETYKILANTICKDSLEKKYSQIQALERSNAAKKWIGSDS